MSHFLGNMAGEDELMLLERVFLRIGSADTDEQLQTALGRFLPPVLLKLASQTDGVRKKVMELLVHINKRVKSRPLIQLPVKDLLLQYLDPSASPFVTNFTILYIKMGYPRLNPELQAELVPQLVMCIAGRPEPQQNSLLQLMMPALQHLKLPSDVAKKRAMFNPEDKPQVVKLILDFMLDLLILPYSFAAHQLKSQARTAQSSQAASQGAQAKPEGSFTGPPPAMSESSFKRVTGENPPTPEGLEKIKLGIIEMLGQDVFPEQDIICHLVVGTADTRHSVATAADRHLKRLIGSQDFNKPAVLSKLFNIFQGTIVVKGKTSTVKPEQKRTPASVQLRLKIFPYFLKSREASNHFPSSIQVVFDCLYGANTNMKLKHMSVQFIHHLCQHCVDSKFNPIASVLMSGMVKLVGDSKDPPDPKLKSLAYVAIGKIAARVPQMVCGDIALLQTLFDAVCKEEADNRLAVQEALSMMATAFKRSDPANAKLIEALIMHSIEKPEPQARLAAVQYAKTVFPPDHIPSRYVLLLACGDAKEDIYSEASKALREIQKVDLDKPAGTSNGQREVICKTTKLMPAFADIVQYIQEKASERVKSSKKYVSGNSVLAFNPVMYGETLMYLRMCLAYNAGVTPNLESMTAMQEQAPLIAKFVSSMVSKQDDKGPVSVYIGIIRQLLTAIGGAPAMYCLLEVVAVARETLTSHFAKHLDWIKNFMFSSKENMRMVASELYALVVATGESPKRHAEVIRELSGNLQSQAFEGQHGSVICLGFLIGHLLANQRARSGQVTLEDMEVDHSADEKKVMDAISKAVVQIAAMLDNSQALLSLGACIALGEIGRCGALPIPNKTGEKDKSRVSKQSIVEKLISKLHSSKENAKMREKASQTLGHLCVGEKQFPHRQRVIEGLMDAAGAKQFELHFTIGEALVCAAQGPSSSASRDLWLVAEEDFKPPKGSRQDEVASLLKLLLEKYVVNPNPHIKQAACIWLVALVKKCGESPMIQKQLKSVQLAFMDLLAQNDEITQDIASKGLGMVYEKCSKEQKDSLVSMLVNTLTSGRKATEKVTGDTKVFSEGSLGQTPEGKSLSTYKELCSIATDLNQPDLIYKFMHLANHNAVWNSKKGAAFGFSTIAAQAGEQLTPYLDQIIPRLYRYQFDPNPRIQQAMSGIWSALVPETNKTVDKYLKEISEDLIKNLTSNQWRVRESSCSAVHDLLRGRPLDDIVGQLPTLWEVLFRVRDDIKESVRTAADTALRTLSRVCIKICDPNYGKVGSRATSVVLPVLVKTGLNSQLQEVRAISLSTMVKISKSAGPLLKPHVPLLVTALLESLSGLEPQYLNYVSLHVASSQAAQEKLDSARVAASKTSPMMETVNLCVQYVDDTVLAELVPRLVDLIKSGIGLGTKVGCANFIISLTHQCSQDLTPYAGKLQNALLNGLLDRNMTVKKSCASAIGHVVKVAKDSSVEKLINKLKTWYLEKEEESVKSACGVALRAIGQRSPDIMKRHAATALPLAFFAMHQQLDNKENQNSQESLDAVWEEVWLDSTPGTEGGLRLYLPEIVTLCQKGLESQSWPTKAQAARAMKTVASKLGANLGPPHLGLLLNALLTGLGGRTWNGKEDLLVAISEVCVSCKDTLLVKTEDQPSIDETLVAILLRECKKTNVTYKTQALKCAGTILEAYNLDAFKDFADLLFPALEKNPDKENEENADVDRDTLLEYKSCVFECLGQSWPQNSATQVEFQAKFFSLLCQSLTHTTWKLEVSALKALNKFLTRLLALQDKSNIESQNVWLTDMCEKLVPVLCRSLGNVKYSSVRMEAMTVTETLMEKLNNANKLDILPSASSDQLKQSLQELSEAAATQPAMQDRALAVVKQLHKPSTS